MPSWRSANTMFSVEWLGHKVALKASNGKYICTKKNGQLLAVSDSTGNTPFSGYALLLHSLLRCTSSLLHSLHQCTSSLNPSLWLLLCFLWCVSIILLLLYVRRGRAAHFKTDQPTHADPERRERIHLPPQELQHTGRQPISLWHFHPAVQ